MSVDEPVVRRKILIDKRFQLQYLYIWLWVGVAMVGMALLFWLLGERVLGERAGDPAIIKFMSGMSGFLVLFCVLMGVVSIFLTHRVAGAAYRLERCIRELADGELENRIALRRGDYLQNLAAALCELQSVLKTKEDLRKQVALRLEQLQESLVKAGGLDSQTAATVSEAVMVLKGEKSPFAPEGKDAAPAAVDSCQPPPV